MLHFLFVFEAWFAGNAPSGDPTLQNQELFKNGMVTKLGCFYSSFDPHQGCGKLAQASETNDPNNMGNGYDGAIILQKSLSCLFFCIFGVNSIGGLK